MSERGDGRSERARPGRAPAASREAVLAVAKASYLAGKRVDVQATARELGLGRVTMYRWFQTREGLLGEAIAEIAEERLRAIRARVRRRGAEGLLEVFDQFNRDVIEADGLRVLLEQEKERALRLLTSANGLVQPRILAATQALIDEEADAGRFVPAIDSGLLAYGIVRLGEAFLYNDALFGLRGDTEHLKEIEAVLLGLRGGDVLAAGSAERVAARSAPGKPGREAASKLSRATSGGVARAASRKPSRAPEPAASTGKLTRPSAHESAGAGSR
ncbi:MAG TPA: QsdR family transcriptional regulator [Solirubrobacteraceae bacterium]|nr:QsdR family transcriptional regulator [Solirubrobacteraceae bacterium]